MDTSVKMCSSHSEFRSALALPERRNIAVTKLKGCLRGGPLTLELPCDHGTRIGLGLGCNESINLMLIKKSVDRYNCDTGAVIVVAEPNYVHVRVGAGIKAHIVLTREMQQLRVEADSYNPVSVYTDVPSQVVYRQKLISNITVDARGAAQVMGWHQDSGEILTPDQCIGPKTKRFTNAKSWCSFYGVPVIRGVAVLYKAVRDDYRTDLNHFLYLPGTMPKAPDWDGGGMECGNGLHFSPTPSSAITFDSFASKFIACPVRVSGIAVYPTGSFPEKCKAAGVCAPCWEVDMFGNKIK